MSAFEVKDTYDQRAFFGADPAQQRAEYERGYAASINDSSNYWDEKSQELLTWFTPYHRVQNGGFTDGDVNWFLGGKLNVSFNCVDRHIEKNGDRVAIIWESDEPGNSKKITYSELGKEVSKIANVLKSRGVKKGDVVTIYMPMVPEVAMVMLACTRIGAIHSIVFAGFSADSLRDRIRDCDSRFVVTTDEGKRGGKKLQLKDICDKAVDQCPDVNTMFVFQYTGEYVRV